MENSNDNFICVIYPIVSPFFQQVSVTFPLTLNLISFPQLIIISLTKIHSIPSINSILIFRFQVCWTLSWDKIETFGDNWNWKRWNTIPTTMVNSALAQHAIAMLSMCYIPGLLVADLQLINSHKITAIL